MDSEQVGPEPLIHNELTLNSQAMLQLQSARFPVATCLCTAVMHLTGHQNPRMNRFWWYCGMPTMKKFSSFGHSLLCYLLSLLKCANWTVPDRFTSFLWPTVFQQYLVKRSTGEYSRGYLYPLHVKLHLHNLCVYAFNAWNSYSCPPTANTSIILFQISLSVEGQVAFTCSCTLCMKYLLFCCAA